MTPRKQTRKLGTVVCDYCGKEFQKPQSEINRNLKKGRKNYCSRECSAKGAGKTRSELPYKPASESMLKHIKEMSKNHRDDYTPFRYIYRCINRRFKETDLTLEDLKELWEKQGGVCPYTGFRLILPENSNIHSIDFFHRASLDRIDSSIGYIKGNVQFVSTPINLMKNSQTDYNVKKFLKEISSYTANLL